MPAEKIATTFVNNGPDDAYTNILRIQWGAKGAVPDAPDGWVNAGYALIQIRRDDDPADHDTHYVAINPEELDHLIRTLKRVRRQAYPKKATMTPEAAALREANIKTLIDEAYGPPIARTNKA